MAPTPPVNSINPIQATPDPEYKSYQWSRAISPIEGNKSSEIAIKGASNMLTEGVNAADTLIKNSLTNDIEDKAGAKRDAYSDELGNTLSTLRGEKTSGAMAYADASTDSASKMNLLSTDKKDNVPPTLQGLKGIVEKQEALKANGKQTESQYLANINSLAKQYRAAWPGYREFIDGTFDQVTQRGPANKLIQSRVAELDAYAAAAKTDQNRDLQLLQHAQEEGVTGANQWEADYKAGKLSSAGLRQKYNTVQSKEFEHKRNVAAWDDEKIGTERREAAAKKVVNSTISNSIDSFVDTMGDVIGSNLDKINSDIATGNPELKGHGEEWATKITAFKQQVIAKATKEAMTVNDKGESVYRDLGPAGLKALLDEHPKIRALNATVDLLASKDHGLATISMRMQHEAETNAQWKLLSENTDMSRALFGMQTVKGLGDAANSKILQDTLGVNGALSKLPEWFQRYNVLGATQPNADESAPGVPYEDKYITLNHAIKEVQANKSTNPMAFQRLFDTTVDNITDPKTPAKLKENYMQFAFNPANLGMLESVAGDRTDPQTGQKIPGKVWLYQRFTSEAVAKSVSEMARAKPQLYAQYQDFVSQEGQHIAAQEIPKLNDALSDPYVKLAYDNTTQQFSVQGTDYTPKFRRNTQPPYMQDAKSREVAYTQETLDKINTVLKSVRIMSQYSPDHPEPNAYAFTLLQAMGPQGAASKKMLDAMMATAPKEKEPTK